MQYFVYYEVSMREHPLEKYNIVLQIFNLIVRGIKLSLDIYILKLFFSLYGFFFKMK
jgi:hypothetical protein